MGYANYSDLERNAPAKLERKATSEAYEGGLNRVAPSGKRANSDLVDRFGAQMKGVGTRWLREWTARVFG